MYIHADDAADHDDDRYMYVVYTIHTRRNHAAHTLYTRSILADDNVRHILVAPTSHTRYTRVTFVTYTLHPRSILADDDDVRHILVAPTSHTRYTRVTFVTYTLHTLYIHADDDDADDEERPGPAEP